MKNNTVKRIISNNTKPIKIALNIVRNSLLLNNLNITDHRPGYVNKKNIIKN